MSNTTRFIQLTALMVLFLAPSARAQWQLNGVALSTATADQYFPTIVSDGAGGAIVTWRDYRSGTNWDIYAQRVNASGAPQWTADGVALCTAANGQYDPTIVSDGAGGAVVTWTDLRSGTNANIYAQRVNASGVPQWTADGVALCTAAFDQEYPTIVSDGAGGAIVTWEDFRSGTADIYAQRVNASGAPQWTGDGVALSTAAFDQYNPTIVSDGAGGAIVTWEDFRTGTADIYAQRVNASGAPQWTADGVALCTSAFEQGSATIVSDGAGGAIVTWSDARSGTNYDIYAQRVNASGAPQWTANGVALCTAAFEQGSATIVSDGAGGAIVTWHDYRSGATYDIYAQRVNASGAPQWAANGVALCTAAFDQGSATIVSDGAGGAIVTWYDYRIVTSADIYAQRVNASGAPQWTADGVALSTAANHQAYPTIVSDGAGGAIVTWMDQRSGNNDIYAQRVESDFGSWGHPEPLVTSVDDIPDDQGGKVAVNWKRSGHDLLPLQEISHYSVWRAADPVAASSMTSSDGWVDPLSIGPDFHGLAFSRERIGATDYYWEWVANQNSMHDAGYSFAAATREDSVAGNAADHYFRVLAHTSNPYVLYKSNALSGHSVDNLAPAAPLFLTAQRVGADVHLNWNRVRVLDLKKYTVYRATSTGVTPIPANFLSNDTDTVLVDASAPTSALYYVVTASDVHENQSAPSGEASVGATTGIGDTPPESFALHANVPNPFNPITTIAYDIPEGGADVNIAIYDVAGRMMRELVNEHRAAGTWSVQWNGDDAGGQRVASGVYFYRMRAGAFVDTKKMVLLK